MKQQTLANAIKLSGKGLHTGKNVSLELIPAAVNHGIQFQRIDLENQPLVPALADFVTDTSRGTTLEKDGVKITTIEHLMATLFALGVDNCLIKVDAAELPIFEGSSSVYVQEVEKAGILAQEVDRKVYEIREKITYSVPEKGIEIVAYPDDKYSVNVLIDYPSSLLKNQYAELSNIEDFKNEISSCRTFVFYSELEPLLKNDLIKGGDIENAVVFIDQDIDQTELNRMADVFKRPHVEKGHQNYLCNPDLKFNNEPARHKLLDVIGDLALTGTYIKGKIIAKRPGHMANTEMAKIIRKAIIKEELVTTVPYYNPNEKPLYDINQIKKMLPHRPPFLLVDKILRIYENGIVGLKSVTMNEPFFVGHFPDEPVMPGVLMIEAMAQVGGIFALSKVEDPERFTTYFMKIDQIKFRDKVVPGDTLLFRLNLISPIRRGIVHMKGMAYVGDKNVFEGEMMAQIAKIK